MYLSQMNFGGADRPSILHNGLQVWVLKKSRMPSRPLSVAPLWRVPLWWWITGSVSV